MQVKRFQWAENANKPIVKMSFAAMLFMTFIATFWIKFASTAQDNHKAKVQVLWQMNLGEEVTGIALTPQGEVIVTTRRRVGETVLGSKLLFINQRGVVQWMHTSEKGVFRAPAVSGNGNYIAVVEMELGRPQTCEVKAEWVVVYDRDGHERWRRKVWVNEPLLSEQGDRVIAVGPNSIASFNGSGQLLWTTKIEVDQCFEKALLSADGHRLLVLRDDGFLLLFDDAGRVLWKHTEKYANGGYIGQHALAGNYDLRYVIASAQPNGIELRFFDAVEGKGWSVRFAQTEFEEGIDGFAVDAQGKNILCVTYIKTGVRLYWFTQEKKPLWCKEVTGRFHLLGVWMQEDGLWGAAALRTLDADPKVQLLLSNVQGDVDIINLPVVSERVQMLPKKNYIASYDAKSNVFLAKLALKIHSALYFENNYATDTKTIK